MQSTSATERSRRAAAEALRLTLCLLVVQALRALVAAPLWSLLRMPNHDQRAHLISALSFLLAGAVLMLWRRPSAAELGLRWNQVPRRMRTAFVAGGLFTLMMVLISGALDRDLLLINVHTVLVTPLFEELLFRGYGWGRLEAAIGGRRAGLWTWLLTTVLFGLWHLGYVDHLLRVMPLHGDTASLATVLVWKVIIGGAVGLAAGWVRWRSGQVFGSLLVHGLWNLFGR